MRGFEVAGEDPSCRKHGGFVVEAVALAFPHGSVQGKYMGWVIELLGPSWVAPLFCDEADIFFVFFVFFLKTQINSI